MFQRCNIYGGPGSGKTTTAARLFADLSARGYKTELAHEYIKSWAYEGRVPRGVDQLYIFAKQIRKEDSVLRGGVQCVVTDAPLMLVAYYSHKNRNCFAKEIAGLAHRFEETHPSINIMLDRTDVPYINIGRYQNAEEAEAVDIEMKNFLHNQGVDYKLIPTLQYDKILQHVIDSMLSPAS